MCVYCWHGCGKRKEAGPAQQERCRVESNAMDEKKKKKKRDMWDMHAIEREGGRVNCRSLRDCV